MVDVQTANLIQTENLQLHYEDLRTVAANLFTSEQKCANELKDTTALLENEIFEKTCLKI